MKAKFVRKHPETKTDIVSFYFAPEHKVSQIAGQYTELSLKGVGKHWFTVSSPPESTEMSITTRLTGSDFKNALNALKPGAEVHLAEPMGDFVLPIKPTRPILMVAGGIGITPFLSILRHNLQHNGGYNLHLLYGAGSEDDFINVEPYMGLLTSFKPVVGRISTKDILAAAKELDEPYIYTSGPEPMVEQFVKELKGAGIPDNRLVADYFPGYE